MQSFGTQGPLSLHNALPPLYGPSIPLGWGSMDGYWVARPNPKTPTDLH